MEAISENSSLGALANFMIGIGDTSQPIRFEMRPRSEQVVGDHPSLLWKRTPGPGPGAPRIQLPIGMRETLRVGRVVYEGEGPHTDKTYLRNLTTAEITASICTLPERPAREDFQALSDRLGPLLKHMVDAAKTFAEGVTHVGIAMANAEAGTLNAIAQRLDGLAATLDKLPRETREVNRPGF